MHTKNSIAVASSNVENPVHVEQKFKLVDVINVFFASHGLEQGQHLKDFVLQMLADFVTINGLEGFLVLDIKDDLEPLLFMSFPNRFFQGFEQASDLLLVREREREVRWEQVSVMNWFDQTDVLCVYVCVCAFTLGIPEGS